jgi:hypothetical protein
MGRMVDVDDLIGSSDIADLLGVVRSAVSNYKKRHPDFPEPVVTIAGVGLSSGITLYLRSEVLTWYVNRMRQKMSPELIQAFVENINEKGSTP